MPRRKIEDHLRDSGLDWTFIRAAYFMQNLSTTPVADIRDRDEIYIPTDRGSRTAHVDVRDVAAVAAARFGLAAGLTDDVERLTGRPAIDFATIARDCRDVWAPMRPARRTERPTTDSR